MNEFEKIIAAEKQRDYQLEDKDQFAFATIIEIQAQKSRLLRRTLWIVLTIIVGMAIATQVYFLQNASYDAFVQMITVFVQTHPYAIGLVNFGILGAIFALKRTQII